MQRRILLGRLRRCWSYWADNAVAKLSAHAKECLKSLLLGRSRWKKPIIVAALALPLLNATASTQIPDSETLAALANALTAVESFEDSAAAQVWLLDMSTRLATRVPDADYRLALLRDIHAAATRSNVPPEMVLAVIQIESNFDYAAISSAGALGLMQVMPFWKSELGRDDDNLLDVRTNLRYGTAILAHYFTRENGNWVRALNRYNGRLNNNPYANKVLHALRTHWFRQ